MKPKIYTTFLKLDNEKEVEITISYVISNDGIGGYEFWGQKCYDHGTSYVEIESQTWNKSLYSPKENEEIESMITEELVEKWIEEINSEICNPDIPEREDEELEDSPCIFPHESEY